MRRILQEVDVTTSASVRIPGNVAEMAARIQQEVGGELFSIRGGRTDIRLIMMRVLTGRLMKRRKMQDQNWWKRFQTFQSMM